MIRGVTKSTEECHRLCRHRRFAIHGVNLLCMCSMWKIDSDKQNYLHDFIGHFHVPIKSSPSHPVVTQSLTKGRKESLVMMMIQTPPAWWVDWKRIYSLSFSVARTDRDDCFRCHTSFSAFTRKHHCRACGETFCATCMFVTDLSLHCQYCLLYRQVHRNKLHCWNTALKMTYASVSLVTIVWPRKSH